MRPHVEIVAFPRTGIGAMTVNFKPVIKGIEGPLMFLWFFGDGENSSREVPVPHYYPPGIYSVLLEVADKEGVRYTASVGIDADAPGCSGTCDVSY